MALTGLDIYKQLPKKNCGKCGPPTCLAFAMQLAAGKASLDACPFVSDAAREALASASAPPIRLVRVGVGDRSVELGDETVIFRHDKTFLHPTGVFIEIVDSAPTDEIQNRVKAVNDLVLERVGQQYRVDGIAIRHVSEDASKFAETARLVKNATQMALILVTDDPSAMEKALAEVSDRKPLLHAATALNLDAMVALAKGSGCALGVKGKGLDEVAALVEKISGMGCKDLVLDTCPSNLGEAVVDYTQIRRLSIKKKYRPLGYPVIAFTSKSDPKAEIVEASVYVAKYANAIVVKALDNAHLMPLLTWRQNIYTDPQKPIQVQAKVYEVGQVKPESPVYVTTNFSLTYFSVEGEVQGSKIPSYILPVDTDGTSVLTAWAAGKFTAEKIAEFLKSCGIESRVSHRKVVIPGHVSVLSGKLQELSGWEVMVGPREASGIPAFAKGRFAS